MVRRGCLGNLNRYLILIILSALILQISAYPREHAPLGTIRYAHPHTMCQDTPIHLAETDVIRNENTKMGKIRDGRSVGWWVYRHYGLL
jgi:hypothetical protein